MKKALLIILGLLLLCCCCSVIAFGLVGHVELNGQCAYKGPLSNETSGLCKKDETTIPPVNGTTDTPTTPTTPTSNTVKYDGINSSKYSFYYPKDFVLSDSDSVVYIYSIDPKKISAGTFNENITIASTTGSIDINETNCNDYTSSILKNIDSSFTVDESSVSTTVETVNGKSACLLSWDAEISGIGFTQHQYVFSDKVNNRSDILTISLGRNSSNEGVFMDIIDSFETK